MDGTRFDRLTRRFARGGTRRNLLRGIAAGLATVAAARERSDVDASPHSVPRGGVCYRDKQCINDYYAPGGAGLNPDLQEVYCRDNGFWYDGEFNCCRYEGGFCGRDEECCGDWSCIDGFCRAWWSGPGNSGALLLGDPCGYPEQCDPSGTYATCGENGYGEGSVCCAFYGAWCESDRQCCGSMFCLNSSCTVPYEGYG